MDGLSCLREIRGTHPQLPTIMVTGAGSQEVAVEAMKLGATDYVVKHRAYLRTVPDIGGSSAIAAPTGVIANQLSVKGKGGGGGTIDLHGDIVTVDGSLRASGSTSGGAVVVVSDSAVLQDKIDVRSKTGSGGTVLVTANAGDLAAGIAMRAQVGGTIATGTAVLDTPPSATCGLVP